MYFTHAIQSFTIFTATTLELIMSQNQSQSTSRQPSVLPPSTAYQRNFKLNNPSLALSSDSKTINGNELLLGDSTDGAYTRKWLNQAVTPVLLEGMKYLAREK